jgi:large subunit ribosomal protein L18
MAKKLSRAQRRRKIHRRIRSKIQGTTARPRLCVFRSSRHIYAQLIEDETGRTLAQASTMKLDGKKLPNGGNVSAAQGIGTAIAKKAKELGVESVVFDRNGFLFHGRIKAVADEARKGGLKF